MKNQIAKPKSTITHIVAACLVLAAFGPPAVELSRASNGRGGPPIRDGGTIILPSICSFGDVQVSGSFKQGVISLPGGGLLIISPENFPTFTNLSDPSKSVTVSNTATARLSTDQNGNIVVVQTGRGVLYDSSYGLKQLIGEWTFTVDANTGDLIDGPTGNGQIIDICELID
jgi:hypothetical protein